MPELNDRPDKGIAIALIGPEPMIQIMLEAIKAFPSFLPLTGTYVKLEEAVEQTEALMRDVEVILYSGPLPYKLCQEKLHLLVPAHYVPLTGSGLYRSLFRIDRKWGLTSVSVDTLPEQPFVRTFRELGQAMPKLIFYSKGETGNTGELVQFHAEQVTSGQAKTALTALSTVSEELNRLGIANEWVLPTEQDVIVALERALLSTETRRGKEAQIVVGLVNVDGFRKMAELMNSENDVQRLKLDIHRMLLEYAESLEGHLTSFGGEEYLFITTRGTFERQTGGYKYIPIAKQARKLLGISLSIGIGFGRSAHAAGVHARTALRHAKEAGGDSCFIVREDEGMIGPLEMADPLEAQLSLVDGDFIRKAEEAGLHPIYLSRILGQMSRTVKLEYNVHELASVLGVTIRTTHRLLLQWADAGLVETVREERGIAAKGRPRQVFRFRSLEHLLKTYKERTSSP
jgi:GTP cyclohydrolase III